MFSPFLLDFFVNTTDPVFIRRLKLEILTCIATETNISTILSELNVCYTLRNLFLANYLSPLIFTCIFVPICSFMFTWKIRIWSQHPYKPSEDALLVCQKLLIAACEHSWYSFPIRPVSGYIYMCNP